MKQGKHQLEIKRQALINKAKLRYRNFIEYGEEINNQQKGIN